VTSPFTVLHVCTGNICRSPMAERILDGDTGEDVFSHSAGISGWHEGDGMERPAADELEARGFDGSGHRARHLTRAHVEASDLILVATAEHLGYVAERFPEAVDKTFPVLTFGEIAVAVEEELPQGDVHVRGKALLAAAVRLRDEFEVRNLKDPWGLSPAVYAEIADELEEALKPVMICLQGDV
jgi:protein-tyrosine phosphatase